VIVYKTTNLINGKVYVGKSTRDNGKYLGSGVLFQQAVKKYGRNNFKKEVLQRCLSESELNVAEKYWIKTLNSTIRSVGYNVGVGGQGGIPRMNKTEEERRITFERRSNAKKGQVPWNKGQHPGASRKGFKLTEAHKSKLCGRVFTKEHRKNISKSRCGGIANNRKQVVQIDLRTGLAIACFNCITDVTKLFNEKSTTNISRVCRGLNYSARGYGWMYKNEFYTVGWHRKPPTRANRSYHKNKLPLTI